MVVVDMSMCSFERFMGRNWRERAYAHNGVPGFLEIIQQKSRTTPDMRARSNPFANNFSFEFGRNGCAD